MTALGNLYQKGLGVSKNMDTAVRLYELAVACNCGTGNTNLAYMYEFGLGVNQNRAKAYTLYKDALKFDSQDEDAILGVNRLKIDAP